MPGLAAVENTPRRRLVLSSANLQANAILTSLSKSSRPQRRNLTIMDDNISVSLDSGQRSNSWPGILAFLDSLMLEPPRRCGRSGSSL
jgi:hypothetical protein